QFVERQAVPAPDEMDAPAPAPGVVEQRGGVRPARFVDQERDPGGPPDRVGPPGERWLAHASMISPMTAPTGWMPPGSAAWRTVPDVGASQSLSTLSVSMR